MILSLSIENFSSFGEKQTINFIDNKNNPLKVYSFIGTNASGKTNIIKVLDFLCFFITQSFTHSIDTPILPLGNKFLEKTQNTNIEIKFQIDEDIYDYSVNLYGVVFKEVLKKNDLIIFEIKNEYINLSKEKLYNENIKVDYKLDMLSNIDIDIDKYKDFIRYNASFISTYPGLNGKLKEIIDVYNYFKNIKIINNTSSVHPESFFTNKNFVKFISNENNKAQIINLLKMVDNDIDDITIIKKEQKRTRLSLKVGSDEKPTFENVDEVIEEIQFIKDNQVFNYDEQSHGVVKLMSLAHEFLPVLDNGYVLVIDEIENGLHPTMYKKIINIFKKHTKNSQLIFNTHNLIFLDYMNKYEIGLVEKENHFSYVKSFSEYYKEDSDYHPFLRDYMIGKITGLALPKKEVEIPNLDWIDE